MATKVYLKKSGVYYREDFLDGRASLRISELNDQTPSFWISKNSKVTQPEGVLVSRGWWEDRHDVYDAAPAPTFNVIVETVTDDHLGKNMGTLLDLLNGKVRVPANAKRTYAEGLTAKAFKAYEITNTKPFFVDDSDQVPMEDNTLREGDIRAYLIHVDHYKALAKTPIPTTYVGTGDGDIYMSFYPSTAVNETITFTATSATEFDVVGSVSGSFGTLIVGVPFETSSFTATIYEGSIPFESGDLVTVTSVAL
jgi:hypothetical protein